MCCVSGRIRCTNGQDQAPHRGANGTNMAFLIVFFTLTGRRGEFPARGGGSRLLHTFTFSILFVPPMLLPCGGSCGVCVVRVTCVFCFKYVAFMRSAFPAGSLVYVVCALM